MVVLERKNKGRAGAVMQVPDFAVQRRCQILQWSAGPFFLSKALSLSHAPRLFLCPQVVFKGKSLALTSHFASKYMLLFTSCCVGLCIFMMFDKFPFSYSTWWCRSSIICDTTNSLSHWYAFFFSSSLQNKYKYMNIFRSFSILQLFASSLSPIHRFPPQPTQGILEGGTTPSESSTKASQKKTIIRIFHQVSVGKKNWILVHKTHWWDCLLLPTAYLTSSF